MKYRYSFLLFFGAFILQGTLLNLFAVFGVTPDLILCLVVMFALFYDREWHALLFGTLFGVLSDVVYMQYIGISALGYLAIMIFVFAAGRIFNRENLMTLLMLTALSAIFFSLYIWCLYFFLGSNVTFRYAMLHMAVSALYDTAVAALLYFLFINKVERFHGDRHYVNPRVRVSQSRVK